MKFDQTSVAPGYDSSWNVLTLYTTRIGKKNVAC